MATVGLLFQKIAYNGKELDLSFLQEGNFVETLDLSGPRLMLSFYDPDGLLRDDLGVKEKAELTISLADPGEGIDQEIGFRVLTMPTTGAVVKLNCLQLDVAKTKYPSTKAILFSKKPVSAIIKQLFSGVSYAVDSLPVIEDYHVLPGQRPSLMLRQMAREKGAALFYLRGKVYCRKLSSLFSATPAMTYEYNNPAAKLKIIQYKRPNTKAIIKDKVDRAYTGFDLRKGYIQAGQQGDEDCPAEFSSLTSATSMNNLNALAYPAIDFVCVGNGKLAPGKMLKLVWKLDRVDSPLDESLPTSVLISVVAHYYSQNKYYCRVQGVEQAK
jgi:hypothetical protein